MKDTGGAAPTEDLDRILARLQAERKQTMARWCLDPTRQRPRSPGAASERDIWDLVDALFPLAGGDNPRWRVG